VHSFFYPCHSQTPTVCSRLKITERSFTHHALVLLWNALPKDFRQPALHSSHVIQFGSTPGSASWSISISPSQFHSKLKTHLAYSINHSLGLSLFHALTSLLWLFYQASGLSSHIHFHFHSPALRPILMNTVSGNKPPSKCSCNGFSPCYGAIEIVVFIIIIIIIIINFLWLAFAGTLNLLTHFRRLKLQYRLGTRSLEIYWDAEAHIVFVHAH